MKKNRNSRRCGMAQAGFTLIELAVVMTILGIVLGGAVFGYAHYSYKLKADTTDEKFDVVMNALSAYAQRYARLPCPADPDAAGAAVGAERLNGDCFVHVTGEAAATTLYANTQGVVPWRELGIPESMVRDGWGRYFTYKPAPQLTVDNYSAEMMDVADLAPLDVNNACRSPVWFDDADNHVDRGKAMFCCMAAPKPAYLTGVGQPAALSTNWRDQAVMAAGVATGNFDESSRPPTNVPVESTNAWTDDPADNTRNGTFANPRTGVANPDAPLMRASGHAVTLISHGGNGFLSFLRGQGRDVRQQGQVVAGAGVTEAALMSTDETLNVWPPQVAAATTAHPKAAGGAYDSFGKIDGASDDRVAYMRADQVYARLGSASCLRPAAAGLEPNEPTCSDSLYGDLTYLVDTSGSMQDQAWNSGRSRMDVARDALKQVIPAQIDQEIEKDVDDPDMVGLNYFDPRAAGRGCGVTYDGGEASGIFQGFTDDEGEFIENPDEVRTSLEGAKVDFESRLDAMTASGNTPLALALSETAKAMKSINGSNGNEDEPNAIIFVSDGYDTCGGNMLWTARRMAAENPYLDVHTVDVANNPQMARMYDPFLYDADNGFVLEVNGNALIIRDLDGRHIRTEKAEDLAKYNYTQIKLGGKYVRPANDDDFVKTLLDIGQCGGGGNT